jgi:transposase
LTQQHHRAKQASYEGYLQTDGYDGYTAIGEKEGIVHVGCWAHAQRKFVEALRIAQGESAAAEMLALIGVLYDIERELRIKFFREGGPGNEAAFLRSRREAVIPILEKIEAYLTAKSIDVPPQTVLGKAIAYTRELWPRLIRYIECPYLTPDNNEAERAIRPFTIGRKKWVISGGPRGAFASAARSRARTAIGAVRARAYHNEVIQPPSEIYSQWRRIMLALHD